MNGKLSRDAKERIDARMRREFDEHLDPGREPFPAVSFVLPNPVAYASNVFIVMKDEYESIGGSPEFVRGALVDKVCDNTIAALRDATASWEHELPPERIGKTRQQVRM